MAEKNEFLDMGHTFTTWILHESEAFNRAYPVPESIKDMAVRYMPRLWMYPDS